MRLRAPTCRLDSSKMTFRCKERVMTVSELVERGDKLRAGVQNQQPDLRGATPGEHLRLLSGGHAKAHKLKAARVMA